MQNVENIYFYNKPNFNSYLILILYIQKPNPLLLQVQKLIKCYIIPNHFFIQAEDGTKTFLKISLEEYYNGTNSKDAVTLAWDSLQMNLKCCGVSIQVIITTNLYSSLIHIQKICLFQVDNGEDYQQNKAWREQSMIIPPSCCALGLDNKPLDPNCTTSPNDANSYYRTVGITSKNIYTGWKF